MRSRSAYEAWERSAAESSSLCCTNILDIIKVPQTKLLVNRKIAKVLPSIMLINSKLPLNIDPIQQQDQTFSLAGMTWTDYEKFNSEEYLGYRVAYCNEVITVVSPSRNQERIAQTIANLTSKLLEKFATQGLTKSALIIESEFLQQI